MPHVREEGTLIRWGASPMEGRSSGDETRGDDHVPAAVFWAIWLSLGLMFVTDWILLDSRFQFAYGAVNARVALETSVAVIGLGVILLSFLRFSHSGFVLDAAIGLAFLVLTTANVSQGLVLPISGAGLRDWSEISIYIWSASRLAALLILLFGAGLHPRQVPTARRAQVLAIGVSYALLIAMAIHVFTISLRSNLPSLLTDGGRAILATDRGVEGAFLQVTVLQIVIQLCLAAVAGLTCVLFLVRTANAKERFQQWVGAALIFWTFSQFHYTAFPLAYSSMIATGDLLRLASYVVVLAAICGEYVRYQQEARHLSMLRERTRIARDIHDGVAQNISFVTARVSEALSGEVPVTRRDLDQWREILQDTQANLRDAVTVLGRFSAGGELAAGVAEFCRDFSRRYALDIGFECDAQHPLVLAAPRDRELLMLLTEALHNVRKHGGSKATVTLESERERLLLRVSNDVDAIPASDDGFTPESSGFGIGSMRERARLLGGSVSVTLEPGTGIAVVELAVPI